MRNSVYVAFGLLLIIIGCFALFYHDKKIAHISAVIVPHHDLVKAERAQFFDEIAKKIPAPQTVILVSPNHYGSGQGAVQTTDEAWELINGQMQSAADVVQNIPANLEHGSFRDEHGIYLILPDVHRVWPDARVVPIMLKFDTPIKSITALNDSLRRTCKKCLLIASVDFSHYQPVVLANEHDRLSVRALKTMDISLIRTKAEVDSPPALQLLVEWARSHATEHFFLWKHTNSGELLGTPDAETTSHVFAYYDDEPKSFDEEKRVSFLFGGYLNTGTFRQVPDIDELRAKFAHLGNRVFWGTDVAIANISGMPAMDVFEENHIQVVGPDFDFPNFHKPTIIHGKGLDLAILQTTPEDQSEQIRELKRNPNMRVVMYMRWDGQNQERHTARQEKLAHAWIDAGADLVIGMTPGYVQDSEVYSGKTIFYSVGELIPNSYYANPQGILVGGAFTSEGLELFTLPLIFRDGVPELARGKTKSDLLKKIDGDIMQL